MMSLLMGVWGWWAFDIFTLICSYLSVEVISAQTVMRSLGLLTFMIPVGIGVANGVLIGQNIGSADIRAIKHYHRLCIWMSAGLGLAQIAVLVPTRNFIIGVFTEEEDVVK